MYNSNTDKRYITKEDILSQLTQEQLFLIVFDKVVEFEYITSPFREDDNPGCWFERYNNILYFIDYGSGDRSHIDCFEAIKIYFNLNSFRETLLFIDDNINELKEKVSQYDKSIIHIAETIRNKKSINVKTRNYYDIDRKFWQKYEITKQNLIDDKVFPVSHIHLRFENEQKSFEVYDVCYAFTDFQDGRKKLYYPYKKGKDRFRTTCEKNDIGNINQINPFSQKLIITKSYKDCRVLRNQGINSIWFQNEGVIPDLDILFPLISHYEDIIIFYDNDNTGIKASNKIANVISSELNKGRSLHLPTNLLQENIKDISDLIVKDKKEVVEFLRKNELYEST